ncbi:MAG TPA: ATP synthase F1 subunit gamma [Bacteroidales bacterium]|jgi:F-type H+-transporting ATPase subunit gamma|nr:ATP synthase F1 subunit gamma [Bacteroidales bacterium]
MANLKAIRIRITSVKSTRQITSAMKMVAAAKLRKAQDKIVRLRPYANKLHEILVNLSQSLADAEIENVYGRASVPEKILIVVVTSNRGLCGAFNSNVVKEARRLVADNYYEQYKKGNVEFLTIGKKGYDTLRKMRFKIAAESNELLNDVTFEKVSALAEKVMHGFVRGDYDRVELIYNHFKNAAVQQLTTEVFLPVESKPEKGKASMPADYIYEPDKEAIVRELIPKSLKIQFYKAVLDSYVAENGARMTAMHKATDNATQMIRELTLQYNKARQAAITGQILEVVSGAEALK